jgi:hypothetical protein
MLHRTIRNICARAPINGARLFPQPPGDAKNRHALSN